MDIPKKNSVKFRCEIFVCKAILKETFGMHNAMVVVVFATNTTNKEFITQHYDKQYNQFVLKLNTTEHRGRGNYNHNMGISFE